MSLARTGAAAAVTACMTIATPMVAQFEGLRTKAYLDAVGIPTICYGETDGVQMGQVRTAEECDTMLSIRLAWYALMVYFMVDKPMTPERHAALASFTYNVGINAFRTSTLRQRLNAGDPQACYQLHRWVYAKGKVLNGLVTRRAKEYELCMR